MSEKTYNKVADFLESRGYAFKRDKDGFWFEDYIGNDHKWKDLFELMEEYAKLNKYDVGVSLPDFLYEDEGEIKIGYYVDSVVTDEWRAWLDGYAR